MSTAPVRRRRYAARRHSAALASRAPSASAFSLTQTTDGWTSQVAAKLAKPQSAPAMTFSRPTAWAKRPMRSAISSGCSTMFEEWVMTPGISDLPSGSLTLFPDPPFVLVARVGRLERIRAGVDPQHDVDDVLQLHVVHARARY